MPKKFVVATWVLEPLKAIDYTKVRVEAFEKK